MNTAQKVVREQLIDYCVSEAFMALYYGKGSASREMRCTAACLQDHGLHERLDYSGVGREVRKIRELWGKI